MNSVYKRVVIVPHDYIVYVANRFDPIPKHEESFVIDFRVNDLMDIRLLPKKMSFWKRLKMLIKY